ncbi:hypothetical protein [Wenjunlia tyrosinilytica]|uniref:hypothetical protein n=1 Tax=Wenjunlia tyrosinilytica TaxID=1544741 RepID=UPI0016698E86|nr:hypothetical protein [Wenjunlia tyrosinilytica]
MSRARSTAFRAAATVGAAGAVGAFALAYHAAGSGEVHAQAQSHSRYLPANDTSASSDQADESGRAGMGPTSSAPPKAVRGVGSPEDRASRSDSRPAQVPHEASSSPAGTFTPTAPAGKTHGNGHGNGPSKPSDQPTPGSTGPAQPTAAPSHPQQGDSQHHDPVTDTVGGVLDGVGGALGGLLG